MIDASYFGDIKVLDLSRGIAGPFCARLLGDFGAEVLKIEPPGGEEGRDLAPFAGDEPRRDKSLFFTLLNLNKRGVTLNLETEMGRKVLLDLAAHYDVVVESFEPGYLDRLGIGWEALAAKNSRLILTSITPFGQTGPYAHYHGEEIVMYALSGIMSYSGTPERAPIKHGGSQALYEGGLNGAAATSVALLARERAGSGQHLDISIVQCISSTALMAQAVYAFTGGTVGRKRLTVGPFNAPVPCKDGYVILGVPNEDVYKRMVTMLELPQLLEPPFDEPGTRRAHVAELDQIVLDRLQQLTRKELIDHPAKLLIGNVQTPQDLIACAHLESRGFYRKLDQPGIGELMMPFEMVQTSTGPCELRLPAPLLGQHNLDVYTAELGYSHDELIVMKECGVI